MSLRAATTRGLVRSPSAGVHSTVNEAFTPRSLPNLAAWFDALDTRTMLAGDGTTITDGGAVALWGDKSGNSGVNCLVLPGVASNFAYVPTGGNPSVNITGNIDVRAYIRPNDWTPGAVMTVAAKWDAGTQQSWILEIRTTGALRFTWSQNGSAAAGNQDSTETISAADYTAGWVRATLTVDNGSSQSEVRYYISSDGTAWSPLGNTITYAFTTAIFNSTAPVRFGSYNGTSDMFSGVIHRAQIYASLNGTDQRLDIDFSTAGKKLANGDKFTCATGQEVTLNSSGATGARIAGERDYFMGTAGSRGTYNAAGKYIATDGTDDYYKTPLFSLPQPVTLYAVLEQTTWTSGDYLIDGSASDTLALIQTTTTPQINLSAGSSVAANTDLATATKALVTIVSNGSSSLVSINRLPATTGNAGAGVPNGLTLASKGTAGSYGNARYYEIAVYRAAHDQATRHRFALYAARKWGFAV